MTVALTEALTGSALEEGLIERLRQTASYLALLADQLEAARAGDAERGRQLAEERGRLEDRWRQADLDDLEAADEPPEIAVRPDVADLLDRGLAELEAHLAAERHAEETWSQLTEGTARSARFVPAPQPRKRKYPDLSKNERRVDVRL